MQLECALEEHRNTPKSLGRVLIDLGYIRERDLVRALAEQVGLEVVDLTEEPGAGPPRAHPPPAPAAGAGGGGRGGLWVPPPPGAPRPPARGPPPRGRRGGGGATRVLGEVDELQA